MADPQKSKVVKKKMETQLESFVVDRIEKLETSNMLLATMVKEIMETSKKNEETCQRLETLLMKRSDQPISAIQHAGQSSVRDPWSVRRTMRITVQDETYKDDDNNTSRKRPRIQPEDGSKSRTFSLMVEPDDTIAAVKSYIQAEQQIPFRKQKLLAEWGGVLKDEMTLGSVGIKEGTTLFLRYTPVKHVIVKTLTGQSITIMVEADDTVGDVKAFIQEKEGIRFHKQRLIYAGKQLESDGLLSDYKIETDAVLHLVLAHCGC